MNEGENVPVLVLDTSQPFTSMMRLFEINYRCGLCGYRHTAESYFTAAGLNPAETLDDLYAESMKVLNSPPNMMPILKGHSLVVHHDLGDLKPLLELARKRNAEDRLVTYDVNSIVMTGEDRFLCDECGKEFPTLASRWTHMGRDPRNGYRVGRYECDPENWP